MFFISLFIWLKVSEILFITILLYLPSFILLIVGSSALKKHNKHKKSPKF